MGRSKGEQGGCVKGRTRGGGNKVTGRTHGGDESVERLRLLRGEVACFLVHLEEQIFVPEDGILIAVQVTSGHLVGMGSSTVEGEDDHVHHVRELRDTHRREDSHVARVQTWILRHLRGGRVTVTQVDAP